MPKPETTPSSTTVSRSKKDKIVNDPKQLPTEIKTKATIEKGVTDLPVVHKVQSVKEIVKTEIQTEKKVLEQSIEQKIEQKSVIEECSILEKSKSKADPPSSSKKDEYSIIEKNKPKTDELSASKKDEVSSIEKIKSKEELFFSKKDEFSSFLLEKNKPKENLLPPKDLVSPKKDESLNFEKNKPKEVDLSSSRKDEPLYFEKNKPKEEDLFSPKKDETSNLEKNKPQDLLFPKKDESLNLEKNKPKEETLFSPKKDEFSNLEKSKPKEDLLSPKKDSSLNLEKNKPKEEELISSKKDESSTLEKSKPKEDLLSPKKDSSLNFEKNKPKEEELTFLKKDESSTLEKSKPKEDLLSLQKDESLNLDKNKPKEEELSSSKKDETISLEKDKPIETKPLKQIVETNKPNKPVNVAVPRKSQPYIPPISNQPPIILATHLVPSLPIGLFEVLAEMIEVATERPVVLLYEPRSDRSVANEYVDIAILPANDDWESGELMPFSFVFEHQLNTNNSPQIYADVIVASDLAYRVEKIIDLRGHRCALPDRRKKIGAATLIYNYLHTIGEGPAFFGNTLDINSQMDAMQMVAGKQAEVGILEAPVITCHKYNLPGVQSLHIVDSLGPLPPYRFMANKKLSELFVKKLTCYIINSNKDASWMTKLAPYGVTGFAFNSQDYYIFSDVKPVFTRGAYY